MGRWHRPDPPHRDSDGPDYDGQGYDGCVPGPSAHGQWGHRPAWASGRRPRWHHPAGLAVTIALVQVVGVTLTARGEVAARELDLAAYALLAVGGLALAGRYRAPVVTLAVTTATTVGYLAAGYPSGPSMVAVIIAMVGAVKVGRRYPTWAVIGVGLTAWAALTGPPPVRLGVVVLSTGLILGAAEWARVGARYQAQAARFREEQARARAEQQRRRSSEERLRIAQELHDVLGHHLSLINVQAGVGLHLMTDRPEQARVALTTIKQASAEALREVRSVLASLDPDSSAPREPAPGLDRLAELTTGAGLPVTVTVTGEVQPLPAEVDRAGYRIVQEALTNVRRHAGPAASATLRLDYRPAELVIELVDDGVGGAVAGDGSGLPGMRERAAGVGGTLTAGPLAGGGFRVAATLPLPAGPVA